MKRLTIMTPKGAALKMNKKYPSESAARADLMKKFRVAVERLAAYEGTGLEPEEIIALIPPPNDPLTLEELREMDGEPVWVVELNDYPPRWGLVYWCRKNKRNIVYVTINNGASICAEMFIAAGGKIYRRKPEEGTMWQQ